MTEDRKTIATELHHKLVQWVQHTRDDILPTVAKMYQGRYFRELGFETWESYLTDGLGVLGDPLRTKDAFPQVVQILTAEGLSQRAIANVTGVSHPTVATEQRKQQESGGKNLPPHDQSGTKPTPSVTQGKDGKTYPKTRQPDATAERRAEVERIVKDHIATHGSPPSSRDVMRQMGRADDRVIRADWDELYKQGKLPKRPEQQAQPNPTPIQLERGEIGQKLIKMEADARSVIRAIQAANPEYRDAARDYWMRLAEAVAAASADLISLLNGEAWDQWLGTITDDTERNN